MFNISQKQHFVAGPLKRLRLDWGYRYSRKGLL
jgi:hypothetical protein